MLYKPPKKAQLTGQRVEVRVEQADYEANGIARYQQKIVFIDGAIPGEHVQIKITEDKAGFLKARTEKVLSASPLRVTPFCAHYRHCGGCQLQHLEPAQQVLLKQQGVDELIRHQTGLTVLPWQALLTGPDRGYRRKARIGVWFDKKQKQVVVGFRQTASKEITAISSCAVLSPVLAPIFTVLKSVVARLPQPGMVTHAEVIDAEGQAYVIIRHTAPLTQAQQEAFIAAWPDAIWLGEAEAGELSYWQSNSAAPAYRLTEQQLTLAFAPDDFIQVNATVNQKMVSQAVEWLAPGPEDCILDLYAGMGNFSLALAQRAKLVHGIEGLTKMVQQANLNAVANQLGNVRFWQADLHLPWGKSDWHQPIYHKVLLDPARAGAQGAVQQVVKLKPAQILYISCNAATFARDAKVLLAAGYHLQKIAGIDMFPHTGHLELMALFDTQKR
ncbi:23S rRNA (uracil(1939)-C(5))-methyltransferase RlmD [Alishewanella sp. d11]|uniref:23S rRNA (uracil(1939)-C(5))-methyltransferase RlmD n=1 Tax=Alishewanella sp. d11 TaxID=3414030 RepID=UPI003BF84F5C